MQRQSTTFETPAQVQRRAASAAETAFRNALKQHKIAYTKSGYPDFSILDQNGIPIGFVEVKRGPNDKRRFDQVAFERFCERFNVPYFLWWPGLELPAWVHDNVRLGDGGVLSYGEAVSLPHKGRGPAFYANRRRYSS